MLTWSTEHGKLVAGMFIAAISYSHKSYISRMLTPRNRNTQFILPYSHPSFQQYFSVVTHTQNMCFDSKIISVSSRSRLTSVIED